MARRRTSINDAVELTQRNDGNNISETFTVEQLEAEIQKAKKRYLKELIEEENDLRKESIEKEARLRTKLQGVLLEEETKYQLDELEFLAKYKKDLEAAGLEYTAKKEAEYLQIFAKQKQLDEVKNLAAIYKKEKELQEDLIKSEREKRKAIIEDPNADPTLKAQAIKEQRKDDIAESLKQAGDNLKKGLATAAENMLNIGAKLAGDINQVMSTYSQYQSAVNARIQGSDKTFQNIEKQLTKSIGVTPYIKNEKLLESVNTLVDQGILFNIEQRAFLETISDEIATTFDTANASLLRIVKLQQQDSSAARLGLEAYLTRYLNSTFQNTEYLTNAFDNVSAALLEASSTMTTEASVQFEYIVQKWLGSLSSVGLSDDAVNSLASAIGYLGSGDIQSLSSNTGMQNLLVMASSKAGIDYASLLSGGLTTQKTNDLLAAITSYIQEIATSGNQLIKSQYADMFGLSLSDLRAAINLTAADIKQIHNNMLDYNGSIQELSYQMTQIPGRMNIGEMIDNVFSNAVFGLSKNIASNAALNSLWKVTSMIEDLTGGIAIPFINAMGFGVDVNTTVTNLMRTGIVGASSLGLIGDVISGIGNTFNPSGILTNLGINNNIVSTSRGKGLGNRSSGYDTSISTFVGNTSSSDIYDSTITSVNDDSNQKLADAKENTVNYSEESYNYLADTLDPKLDYLLATNDYLTTVFDPKMNALLRFLTGNPSYNPTINSSTSSYSENVDQSSLDTTNLFTTLTNHSTAITDQLTQFGDNIVKIAAATDNTEKCDLLLLSLDNNVKNIYELLSSVISSGAMNIRENNLGISIPGITN